MNTLTATGLGLSRSGRTLLRDVSLALPPGTICAFVGPNGSGKSSLMRCLAGLWRPSEGRVQLGNHDLHNLRRDEVARNIAYVPQEARFDFAFTVGEVVRMGRYAHRGRFERESPNDRAIVEEAMERTDIRNLYDRPITELSGGERQRVLIARTLATRAHTLLLDEPTANLDVNHALDILNICRALADEGRSIAIATHDLNAVCRGVDFVALIDSGRLAGLGTPQDVLTGNNLEKTFRVRAETLTASDGKPCLLFHRLDGSEQ